MITIYSDYFKSFEIVTLFTQYISTCFDITLYPYRTFLMEHCTNSQNK